MTHNAKDKALKLLYRHNDVYADILNGLLFDGKPVIKPEELEPVDTVTEYEGENHELYEQLRDASRYWKVNGKIRARLCLENETDRLWYMPARTFGYDGPSYAWQYTRAERKKNHITRKNPGHAVITLVLYFGMEKWNYSTSLNEMLKVHPRLRPFAPDYHMNLFQIAWLTKEEIDRKFHNDFRILADYLKQKRETDQYVLSDYPMIHPHDIMLVMNAFTGRNWISQEIEKMIKEGKEISMVDAYAEVRKQEYQRGFDSCKSQMEDAYADVRKQEYQRGFDNCKSQMEDAYADVRKQEYQRGFDSCKSQMEDAYADARKQEYQRGFDNAREQLKNAYDKANRQNAVKMLKDGKLSIDDISDYSGLSKEEVQKLKDSLN